MEEHLEWLQTVPYPQLHQNVQSIRLVRVIIAENVAGMVGWPRCEIFSVPFYDAPRYTAVSYAWGQLDSYTRADSDGTSFYLCGALGDVLRNLALNGQCKIPIWIDALCINQCDYKEKTEQIQMMPEIYQQCYRLCVFLAGERIGRNKIDHVLTPKLVPGAGLRRPHNISEARSLYPDLAEAIDDKDWYGSAIRFGVKQMLSESWWHRIWVVQEVVHGNYEKSNKTLIIWRGQKIPWNNLEFAHGALRHLLFLKKDYNLLKMLDRISILEKATKEFRKTSSIRHPVETFLGHPGRSSLLELLVSYRNRRATDKRDKVYAVLGLTNQLRQLLAPDYGVRWEIVYQQAVLAHISIEGSLEFLRHSSFKDCDDSLPSWVPDWSQEAKTDILNPGPGETPFNASGLIQQPHAVAGKDKCLSIKMQIISRVAESISLLKRDASDQRVKCRGIGGWPGTVLFMHELAQCKNKILHDNARSQLSVKGVLDAFLYMISPSFQGKDQGPYTWIDPSEHRASQSSILNEGPEIPLVSGLQRSPNSTHNQQNWFPTLSNEMIMPWGWPHQSTFPHPDKQLQADAVRNAWATFDLSKNPFAWNLPDPYAKSKQENELPFSRHTNRRVSRNDFVSLDNQYAIDEVSHLVNRSMVFSEQGVLCLGPADTKTGDVIVVIEGATVPFILRDCSEGDHYHLLGEVYMRGFMHGTHFIRDRGNWTMIKLR